MYFPSSMTFTLKLLCFQLSIMELQTYTLPSSHWFLVWKKCTHCLINPVYSPWRKVASNVSSTLQQRKQRQNCSLSVQAPDFQTFPCGYPIILSQSTCHKSNSFASLFWSTLFLGITYSLIALRYISVWVHGRSLRDFFFYTFTLFIQSMNDIWFFFLWNTSPIHL